MRFCLLGKLICRHQIPFSCAEGNTSKAKRGEKWHCHGQEPRGDIKVILTRLLHETSIAIAMEKQHRIWVQYEGSRAQDMCLLLSEHGSKVFLHLISFNMIWSSWYYFLVTVSILSSPICFKFGRDASPTSSRLGARITFSKDSYQISWSSPFSMMTKKKILCLCDIT